MTEAAGLILYYGIYLAGGAVLGLAFLWGLWLTVQKLPTTRHPALLVFASLILRFAISLAGFYVIVQMGSWDQILVAVAGFTLPRLFLSRRLQRPQEVNGGVDS
ncbi:F1/F0 ATPase, Methanosarcina type subunit 2 [Marinobacter santoriniensis NKSG1]|uniref:F1/F0 ATPase, Methanosarcina type subunit 2 n=1 Tax=Marinobacter santoriniensis NKSG1 TaxID=1288826 RepID=M7D724_9GAMM|nr:ATP synthase subunit I [Marinobacter santoriniensis]EMP56523.1 F1/F0 ATPase, Methanosarcina type subunit 2 [Marinobacter santoriniensis NKSG1]